MPTPDFAQAAVDDAAAATDLAASATVQQADLDARKRDPRWIMVNGAWHQLPPASTDPSQPAPVITYDLISALYTGEGPTNAVAITWRRFGPGDDDRNPSEYGRLGLTKAPLIRKPGYRFTVTRSTDR